MNSVLDLVKPLTIWKLKYGRIVMVERVVDLWVTGGNEHDKIVEVIRQDNNITLTFSPRFQPFGPIRQVVNG